MQDLKLTEQYKILDEKCATFYYKLTSKHEFEPKWFVPTTENIELAWNEWEGLKHEVEAIEAPDAVYTLIKHHLCDFIETLKYQLQKLEKNPFYDYLEFYYYFTNIARLDKRHKLVRHTVIKNRIAHLRKNTLVLLKRAKEVLSEKEQYKIAQSLRQTQQYLHREVAQLIDYFPMYTTDQIRDLADDFFALHRTFEHLIQSLTTEDDSSVSVPLDDLSIIVKTDVDTYRNILLFEHGVNLDELLDWGQSEIEKTRAEVFSIASKLPIEEDAPKTMREVNDILFKYEGPCETPEEMFARAENYLKRTRALAHEYLNLPEDESCLCTEVPYSCKDSYPWGGYEGGDFRKPPYQGRMFLNQMNYKNVTDGWIKLNSLHEAYPGHHVQFVRSAMDPLPETVKIGAKLTPLLEGTCLRTERAFESLFDEDPFFPLFVAYRRHHGAVRIVVDLLMYYYGEPLQKVVDLYQEELGFDYITARGQVLAHQNMTGYFTCYYYGMKKIEDWDKKLGLSKKDFTELLFSAGFISMESFEMYARLTPEERKRYYTEFKSLRMK